MESTWENRDLPVLDAAVRYVEEHRGSLLPQAFDLAPMVGLDADDVGLALLSLDGEYIDVMRSLGGLSHQGVQRIYPSARRAVGQWPTPESLADRILAQMQVAAETETDPEKRSKLKATAAFLGSSGRELLVNVMAAVIVKSSGIG